MIVSCPECHTLYRHRIGARRRARCGTCHAEVVLPAARTYLVQAVTGSRAETIPVPLFAGVASVPQDATGSTHASPWGETADDARRAPRPRPGDDRAHSRPGPERQELALDDPPEAWSPAATGQDGVDPRLDEIMRAARQPVDGEGAAVRAVLLGAGLGMIAGVAFAPGLFHAPWLSWAAGGVMGGALGALWSRAWGSRRF